MNIIKRIWRSAVTGRYITKGEAEANPHTSVTEQPEWRCECGRRNPVVRAATPIHCDCGRRVPRDPTNLGY